jgi:hypothetical protein
MVSDMLIYLCLTPLPAVRIHSHFRRCRGIRDNRGICGRIRTASGPLTAARHFARGNPTMNQS